MVNDDAITLMAFGETAMRRGHNEEAAYFFRAALKIRPDMVEAYIKLALAYSNNHKYVGTVSAFRRAVKLNPLSVREWAKTLLPKKPVWLSNSLKYTHLSIEASDIVRRLDEVEALAHLGVAHVIQGAYRAAVFALEGCLKLTPDYTAAIILLITAYVLLEGQGGDICVEEGGQSALRHVSPELVEELFIEGMM